MKRRRAILVFIRNEREEGRMKPLPRRFRSHGYAVLNRKIISRIEPLSAQGIDIIIARENASGHQSFTTIRQHGTGFGERITNAIKDTFALGYWDVVVIGNDCPTITTSDITTAFTALAEGATYAAAPASDGGAFLIGASRHGFSAGDFTGLPWKTSRLFAALTALPEATGLNIRRDDFDDWMTTNAQRVLTELLTELSTRLPNILPSDPAVTLSRIRAMMRIYLPAPPTT